MKSNKILFFTIFIILFLIHLFIFREVLLDIPEIIRGEKILVREELVPFFNVESQFIDQLKTSTSDMTFTDEYRSAYSFWTSWVRYYKVLPFALILLNTLSAFILFYAFYVIGKAYYGILNKPHIYAILVASFVIHFILLYSKITHFYTLVFGFSLFALAVSYTLKEIIFERNYSFKRSFALSLIILVNPAIHYHVIYYILLVLILTCVIFADSISHKKIWIAYKDIKTGIIIFIFSLLPYLLLINLITSNLDSSIANTTPVNYWMILYSSSSLLFLFSLDTAAQIDLYYYGNYLSANPRYLKSILFALVIFVVSLMLKERQLEKKKLILLSFFILVFSIWMSIGYDGSSYSFHVMVQSIEQVTNNTSNLLLETFNKVLFTFIQVLRFPHRFNFIQLYFFGILLALSLVFIGIKKKVKYTIGGSFLCLVLLFGHTDYRRVLTTGDFDRFLSPIPVQEDLKNIKEILGSKDKPKLYIVPTLESGREVVINNNAYNFIDKFFIYYLDIPTFYYGTGANVNNKLNSFLVYQSILERKDWWVDVLTEGLDINYILVLKSLEKRQTGLTYIPEFDAMLHEALKAIDSNKIYDGSDYVLYELNNIQSTDDYLLHLSWDKLNEYFEKRESKGNIFFSIQLQEYFRNNRDHSKNIVTDNIATVFFDFVSLVNKNNIILPDNKTLPFTDQYIPSTFYTTSPLSLATLLNPNDRYNYYGLKINTLYNLKNQFFVGSKYDRVTTIENDLTLHLKLEKGIRYKLLLRGYSSTNELKAELNGKQVLFEEINSEELSAFNFTYYALDYLAESDEYIVTISNITNEQFFVESMLTLKQDEFIIQDGTYITDDFRIIKLSEHYYKLIYE